MNKYFFNGFTLLLGDKTKKFYKTNKYYKELVDRREKLGERYRNVLRLYEDFQNIRLSNEEMKVFEEIVGLDEEIHFIEKTLCFELGIKEGLYWKKL